MGQYLGYQADLEDTQQNTSTDEPILQGGLTPLHVAVLTSNVPLVKGLLGQGMDIHAIDDQDRTPLHIANEMGNEEIIELLNGNDLMQSTRFLAGATSMFVPPDTSLYEKYSYDSIEAYSSSDDDKNELGVTRDDIPNEKINITIPDVIDINDINNMLYTNEEIEIKDLALEIQKINSQKCGFPQDIGINTSTVIGTSNGEVDTIDVLNTVSKLETQDDLYSGQDIDDVRENSTTVHTVSESTSISDEMSISDKSNGELIDNNEETVGYIVNEPSTIESTPVLPDLSYSSDSEEFISFSSEKSSDVDLNMDTNPEQEPETIQTEVPEITDPKFNSADLVKKLLSNDEIRNIFRDEFNLHAQQLMSTISPNMAFNPNAVNNLPDQSNLPVNGPPIGIPMNGPLPPMASGPPPPPGGNAPSPPPLPGNLKTKPKKKIKKVKEPEVRERIDRSRLERMAHNLISDVDEIPRKIIPDLLKKWMVVFKDDEELQMLVEDYPYFFTSKNKSVLRPSKVINRMRFWEEHLFSQFSLKERVKEIRQKSVQLTTALKPDDIMQIIETDRNVRERKRKVALNLRRTNIV
eukprot:TRINITY_DN1735_c0_g1_i3.p1 TRINITY_DN1735_c0_g1~~TRINITY_DN1735_c0_g1_i3.p1  ORF type:complete len:579 (+),score=144.78 TRINITY_DN1735_c0_g1_i3:3-1739(+)